MPFVELLRRPVVWAGAASAAMVLFLLLRPSSPAISPVVWTESSANLPPEMLQPGAAAPDFVLPAVVGGTVALGGLQGKSALLVFVTAECLYCQKLQEHLEAFEPHEDQQLVFFCPDAAGAQTIRETYSFAYPVLIDSAGTISRAYKTSRVPTVYQINAEGNVVDSAVGWPPTWDFVQRFGRPRLGNGTEGN